jgi:stage II sporulation protein D
LAAISAASRGRLEASGDALLMGGKRLGPEAEVRAEVGDLKVAGRRYGGRVLLRANAGQVLLINEISLQDYLKGVLPSEVPASWPLESLKAQALAARSYAVWRAGETRKSGASAFDLDDSVASQAYQGLEKRDPRTDKAVDLTDGEILAFQGKIAECFFHSNSGGHTAGADEVWGGKSAPAYLNGVLDSWSEDQKHYAWSVALESEQVEARLSKAGLFSGLLEEVVPKSSSDSGRWEQVRLIGSNGEKVVKASAFRNALGADVLRSTNFRVRRRGSSLVFDGLGWGHGVGLAQEGAKAMAEAGKDYRSILSHYYPGTRWARLR